MLPAAVFYRDESYAEEAAALGRSFSIPVWDASVVAGLRQKELRFYFREKLAASGALFFQLGDDGLVASMLEGDQLLSIQADFVGSSVSYRRKKGGGRGEMIAKAIGLKGSEGIDVLDATAGLGGDAFVLASVGCRVRLLERVSVVRALLSDAFLRAKLYASNRDEGLSQILDRMEVVAIDSAEYLQTLEPDCYPEVIYLDPMFPERKKSAAVKKEMQVFHRIVGSDTDADRLFELSLARARSRVVVKRPRVAPELAGARPHHVLEGKRNRFDIYLA